ncbi:hypothetical protein AB0L56_02435 [Streptomyces sp. NPDC052079]|uniref:hypothetical protein n=1 Tax=unclassified Streptomyces TaxID=2593676 RepID=UPI0033F4DBDB
MASGPLAGTPLTGSHPGGSAGVAEVTGMSGAPVLTSGGRTVPAGGVVISDGFAGRRSSPVRSLVVVIAPCPRPTRP